MKITKSRLHEIIVEELTKTDKDEIKRMISKELKKMVEDEVAKAIKFLRNCIKTCPYIIRTLSIELKYDFKYM